MAEELMCVATSANRAIREAEWCETCLTNLSCEEWRESGPSQQPALPCAFGQAGSKCTRCAKKKRKCLLPPRSCDARARGLIGIFTIWNTCRKKKPTIPTRRANDANALTEEYKNAVTTVEKLMETMAEAFARECQDARPKDKKGKGTAETAAQATVRLANAMETNNQIQMARYLPDAERRALFETLQRGAQVGEYMVSTDEADALEILLPHTSVSRDVLHITRAPDPDVSDI